MSAATTRTLLVVCLLAGPAVTGCSQQAEGAGGEPAAVVEEIPGSEVKKVLLTTDAAEALGVATETVTAGPSGRTTLPYAAVLYYLDGTSWTYMVTGEREYVRVPITVASIAGGVATLSEGPPAGTSVVVVGAPELLGAELEIDGEQ